MPNSRFVRIVLKALDQVQVQLSKRKITRNGHPVLGWIDGTLVTLYPKNHHSFDDLCVTLLHEALHHADEGLPEYLIDEALDRAAFTSCRLRWAAAEKIGTLILKF